MSISSSSISHRGVANSPATIDLGGRQGSGDGADDGAQDTGHAVEVVNATRVLNLQLLLQDWLRWGQEVRWRLDCLTEQWVNRVLPYEYCWFQKPHTK